MKYEILSYCAVHSYVFRVFGFSGVTREFEYAKKPVFRIFGVLWGWAEFTETRITEKDCFWEFWSFGDLEQARNYEMVSFVTVTQQLS